MPRLLNRLDLPQALKDLSLKDLQILAQDIRDVILEVLPKTGGHGGTNLGVVELTLALHQVFDFSHDRLLFDVGHQAYAHKLLTGRLDRFSTLRQKDGLCGYPSPWESEYDCFLTGHAGTAISSALGMRIGYDRLGESRKVVAVVGDGSICGLAFEGLNHAGALKRDLLVVLNDNRMAISPTVGAMSRYLNQLRSGESYLQLMEDVRAGLKRIPLVGEKLEHLSEHVRKHLCDNLVEGQLFRELGFQYFGPVDGHDLEELATMLHNLKDLEGPVLLHVLTEKGRGIAGNQEDPYSFHAISKVKPSPKAGEKSAVSYSKFFVDVLIQEAEKNDKIYAITAAMAEGTKLEDFMKVHPENSVDTGIAEAHAVTLAGGMDAAGLKPVVLIYSTFLQRAYDSVMHDICLQKGAGAIFAIDRGGLVGDDGPSHHGVYDVAFLRHLPRMIIMAPRDGQELEAMFKFSLKCTDPVAFRYPRGDVPDLNWPTKRPAIELGKPEIMHTGKKIALVAYGAMVEVAVKLWHELKKEGIDISLVNLRFVKPMCAQSLKPVFENHEHILSLEDHALAGGVGSALLELAADNDFNSGKVHRLGIPDEFVTYAERSELFAMLKLDAKSVAEFVRTLWNKK